MSKRKAGPPTRDDFLHGIVGDPDDFLAARFTKAEFELGVDELVRRGSLNSDFTLSKRAMRQALRMLIYNHLYGKYGPRRTLK